MIRNRRGTKVVTSAFEDAGLPPAEVAVLETKTLLMIELTDILDATGMTQAQAAKRFGVTQPRVSDLRRGKIGNFSVDTLIGMLARTGRDVQLVVRRRR
jgi:predicted XRE-type DNA-binding protein